ncbi:MAG: cardiolipin synthase, partial [Clostridiales bacterium]|nr:cardiolipin synthase [Clostridiales bacterium]
LKEGTTGIQIVSSGPDSAREEIKRGYMKMVTSATKSVYLQTPYFVPDDSLLESIKIAAMSGVDVRIMIPCMPDHMFVYWATYSYIGDLVMAGANCYTYNNGFLHAKGVLVDDDTFCYGTANMDIRSFRLNFEVNVTVYSDPDAIRMKELFIADLKYATQITKENYSRRDLGLRIKEQFCRLLSPLL